MLKKLSQALLIPTISVLPFTQSVALPRGDHPEIPVHQEKTQIRNMVIRGQMVGSNTIQINKEDLAKLNQPHAIRIITLLDDPSNKQRLVLLTPNRSKLVKYLMTFHGHLKEFQFYPVKDKNGDSTDLFASKRILTAPANQLTVVFDSTQDARDFFSNPQIKTLLEEESLRFSEVQTKKSVTAENQTTEQNELSNEIAQINNEVSAQGHDQSKTAIVETPHLFPMVAPILVSIKAAT